MDIDINNKYSRQQLLMLLQSYIKTQQQKLRQAKLTNNVYRVSIAKNNIEQAINVYNKVNR